MLTKMIMIIRRLEPDCKMPKSLTTSDSLSLAVLEGDFIITIIMVITVIIIIIIIIVIMTSQQKISEGDLIIIIFAPFQASVWLEAILSNLSFHPHKSFIYTRLNFVV